ncbi:hypothetical protein BJX66DRAFT_346006 [Aspergillus keveii]|uniref:BTB domain-containing protein n=1 Tax=Aspergillus keveii TaxID=714993 RepID=A0ABR4FGS1_9EURO
MPFNMRYYQQMVQTRRAEYSCRIRELWTSTGPDAESADTVVIVGDITVRAHSSVLRRTSSHFDNALAAAIPAPGDAGEVHLPGVDAHTFWRALQLVYCRSYSLDPCPWTSMAVNTT